MDILKPPKQARSRATLARIERAAIALIAEKGPEGANVQDITRRAKSSVGSFYARFEGKDELLTWLRARVWQDVRDRWDASAQGAPTGDDEHGQDRGGDEARDGDEAQDGEDGREQAGESTIAADGPAFPTDRPAEALDAALYMLAGRIIRAFVPDARARRILETHRSPTDLDDRARDLVDHIAADSIAALLKHGGDIHHKNPELSVRLVLGLWVAAAREFTETGSLDALRGGLDDMDLALELMRIGYGYLSGGPAEGAARSSKAGPAQIEFFDVWG